MLDQPSNGSFNLKSLPDPFLIRVTSKEEILRFVQKSQNYDPDSDFMCGFCLVFAWYLQNSDKVWKIPTKKYQLYNMLFIISFDLQLVVYKFNS